MSTSANLPESESSACCPSCKKPLLSRSARLCGFCGEKLPENLLFPLSEVRREEERSQVQVNRVINAYGKREAEIAERASTFTHSGAMFGNLFKRIEQHFQDLLFPEISSDEWALHEFRRTLKLPDDDFEARRDKKELDGCLRKLASKLAATFGRLECKLEADKAGHLCARLTDDALSVAISTQFGTNATFTNGVSHSFVSYSIRAEARVLALNQADEATRKLSILCSVAGIVGVPAGLIWFGYTVARALGLEVFHQLWLSEFGIGLAVLVGAWVGAKTGRALSTSIDKRASRRAEVNGVLLRAESLWKALLEAIDEITGEYEVV